MFSSNIHKKAIYLLLLRELFTIFLFNQSLNLSFIEELLTCALDPWPIWYVDKVNAVLALYQFEIQLRLYEINMFYVQCILSLYFLHKVNLYLNNISFNKIKLNQTAGTTYFILFPSLVSSNFITISIGYIIQIYVFKINQTYMVHLRTL